MSVFFRLWNAINFRVLDFTGKTVDLETHSLRCQQCVEKDPRPNVSISMSAQYGGAAVWLDTTDSGRLTQVLTGLVFVFYP